MFANFKLYRNFRWNISNTKQKTIKNHFFSGNDGQHNLQKDENREQKRTIPNTALLDVSTKKNFANETWKTKRRKVKVKDRLFFLTHSFNPFFGNNEHKKYLNRFDAVATFALTYSFTFIGNGLRFVCFGSFRWFYWYQAIWMRCKKVEQRFKLKG